MALTREQLESSYKELESVLFNFAFRWVFNSSKAEELVHEAFVKIWIQRKTVGPETLKPLLYKTVQNLALNEIRRNKVQRLYKEALFLVGIENNNKNKLESDAIDKVDLKNLKIALEALPIEYREVLLMSEFSNLSYHEISINLEIAEGTVASRKNRALQMLRDQFLILEGNGGK